MKVSEAKVKTDRTVVCKDCRGTGIIHGVFDLKLNKLVPRMADPFPTTDLEKVALPCRCANAYHAVHSNDAYKLEPDFVRENGFLIFYRSSESATNFINCCRDMTKTKTEYHSQTSFQNSLLKIIKEISND